MKLIRYPEHSVWPGLVRRPGLEAGQLESRVKEMIRKVAAEGDAAVRSFTREFDGVEPETLEVSREEILAAGEQVPEPLKKAIGQASRNIENFHRSQLHAPEPVMTAEGVRCWQKPVPIQRVGLYIPGGTAPLLSTVLMLGIPARIAGCPEVILCTPPDREGRVSPAILYIAGLLGMNRVFRVGGVQAIAAMAYGTATIPAVDKIFGPGNQYVTMAKQVVSRDRVAIDMPAGPSELAVLADETADPSFVASDLLSQAEHGPDSQVLLVTSSEKLITAVQKEIDRQLEQLPRKETARLALENSRAILLKERSDMIGLVNLYAPEHLIITTREPHELAEKVRHAGSVFIGSYTPESAGDYASGTNHTLPTGGWARSFSGVNMDSYFRKITFQEITPEGLSTLGETIMTLAEAEGLQAHARAVALRMKSGSHE
ncbi:MAG: histidinol dehydrogenase [Bacteroidales bacterium]